MKVLEKEIQAPYSRGSKKPDILYNESNTCEYIDENEERCKEKLKPGNARRERNKDHIPTEDGYAMCTVTDIETKRMENLMYSNYCLVVERAI